MTCEQSLTITSPGREPTNWPDRLLPSGMAQRVGLRKCTMFRTEKKQYTQLVCFRCNRCDAPITRALMIADTSQYTTRGGESWKFGEPCFPAGFAIRERGDVWKAYAGCWLVQEDDVIGLSVTHHVDRTNGCCGMTGWRGPNLICRCGEHVASAETDCTVPNFVALNKDQVYPVRLRLSAAQVENEAAREPDSNDSF
ncbi:hypothetical protein R69927_03263 [Paraburkholderia domus]|jgi:hypothetical protein|uniref:Uncharacterized protein n=2 Tax=Paraburkholderia domus TaxID=2793075 RepID=A0A9N8QXV7_9BURK|nr:hypothetical protein R75483_00859 [Paraburkholderia domus]CAE6744001.1 hypothetical protein R69749_00013 [Paraburkholderia domus]CAE6784430.1 hypothetical protein R70006_04562 [Paraburkholderia domus]CAE6869737.1 hypothetical protein R69927_03263 [Paraburkholderia domus]CAE6876361.1 hypothetical protein R70211_01746 [Paraburkholderia domus]